MDLEPEYNTLREEIGRLQDQVARFLEIGIVITSGILTISYSSVIVSKFQWIALLSPSILLIPFVYLILDRVRTTWIIGRYIELNLEPKLGFQWETFNRHLRAGANKHFRSRFARTSIFPLIVIQFLCPVLSASVGVPDIRYWLGAAALVLIVIVMEYRALEQYTLTQAGVDEMKQALKALKAPAPPQQDPAQPA
jgi:hypothetical protein